MKSTARTLRTCKKGHSYFKSSDCPVCPQCENEKKPVQGFLSVLAAPARRAFENNGIKTIADLARYSENDILKFHGMGKASLSALRKVLLDEGFKFKS